MADRLLLGDLRAQCQNVELLVGSMTQVKPDGETMSNPNVVILFRDICSRNVFKIVSQEYHLFRLPDEVVVLGEGDEFFGAILATCVMNDVLRESGVQFPIREREVKDLYTDDKRIVGGREFSIQNKGLVEIFFRSRFVSDILGAPDGTFPENDITQGTLLQLLQNLPEMAKRCGLSEYLNMSVE